MCTWDNFEGTKCKGRSEGKQKSSQGTEKAEPWLGPDSDDQGQESQEGPEVINSDQRS